MNFKINDFALLEGKIVQITRIRLNDSKTYIGNDAVYDIQVKLYNDSLKHWVDFKALEPLACQKASKILFSNKN